MVGCRRAQVQEGHGVEWEPEGGWPPTMEAAPRLGKVVAAGAHRPFLQDRTPHLPTPYSPKDRSQRWSRAGGDEGRVSGTAGCLTAAEAVFVTLSLIHI